MPICRFLITTIYGWPLWRSTHHLIPVFQCSFVSTFGCCYSWPVQLHCEKHTHSARYQSVGLGTQVLQSKSQKPVVCRNRCLVLHEVHIGFQRSRRRAPRDLAHIKRSMFISGFIRIRALTPWASLRQLTIRLNALIAWTTFNRFCVQ